MPLLPGLHSVNVRVTFDRFKNTCFQKECIVAFILIETAYKMQFRNNEIAFTNGNTRYSPFSSESFDFVRVQNDRPERSVTVTSERTQVQIMWAM